MITVSNMIDLLLKRVEGGKTSSDRSITRQQAFHAIIKATNEALKVDVVQHLKVGEVHVSNAMIALYEDVALADNPDTGRAELTLPATPMSLTHDIGVWKVYSKSDPDNPYIPIPSGFAFAAYGVSHNSMAAVLGSLTCYEVSGNILRFNKSVAEIGNQANVELLIVDIATLSPFSTMPIPPEMEGAVLNRAVQLLLPSASDDVSGEGVKIQQK